MSLDKFASNMNSLTCVSDVYHNKEEDEVKIIFESDPKSYVSQIQDIRNNYPEVIQSNKYTEDNKTILIFTH